MESKKSADFGDLYCSQIFRDPRDRRIITNSRKMSLFNSFSERKTTGGTANGNKAGFVEDKGNNDDLYFALRFFLRFGRVLGIIPVSGLLGARSDNLKFR
jgi:hypothetical protein